MITDILAGLSVSLALLPECLGLVAGVAPLVSLYAAFIIGLTIEVFMPKA